MTQPDMNEILARAAEMQAQMQQAQQEILDSVVAGSAGNGLVEVTMTGSGEVKSVKIDPQVVDPEDVDTLQDLIVGAFEDAHAKAGQLAEEKIGPLAQGGGNPFGGLM
ncbi:YbaB/EbfC family nucleoid-associated protein [Corynebacterium sp.]|uniref:YbaB/EbfC family nucleoid-associated protein n=1 Tax=Corynebacterium sp. TaxID=1720 RepID=UPI003736238D